MDLVLLVCGVAALVSALLAAAFLPGARPVENTEAADVGPDDVGPDVVATRVDA